MPTPQAPALLDNGDHSARRAREVCRPPDARSSGGPTQFVVQETSTTVVRQGLQKTWRQTTIQQAFGQSARLCEFGHLPSTSSLGRQNWRSGGPQVMSRNHPYRCVAQRLGCYHGCGEQSCPDGQGNHPPLQNSPGRNHGTLSLIEPHWASVRDCVLAQDIIHTEGAVSYVD